MTSTTDRHWSERALTVGDDADVNITDVCQRELEFDAIDKLLEPDMQVLEAGCGNGFSTARFRKLVAHIDAFDQSAAMIARAKSRYGESNNRFFCDSVLEPTAAAGPYDAVLCIRVLINLRDLDEQRRALGVLTRFVKPAGRLILAEGFSDGFGALTDLRRRVGLPPIEPSSINCYSAMRDVVDAIGSGWRIAGTFHLGMYDYLTRVVYPMMVGADKVRHNSDIAERCLTLARRENPASLESLSRLRGFVFQRSETSAPAVTP